MKRERGGREREKERGEGRGEGRGGERERGGERGEGNVIYVCGSVFLDGSTRVAKPRPKPLPRCVIKRDVSYCISKSLKVFAFLSLAFSFSSCAAAASSAGWVVRW